MYDKFKQQAIVHNDKNKSADRLGFCVTIWGNYIDNMKHNMLY